MWAYFLAALAGVAIGAGAVWVAKRFQLAQLLSTSNFQANRIAELEQQAREVAARAEGIQAELSSTRESLGAATTTANRVPLLETQVSSLQLSNTKQRSIRPSGICYRARRSSPREDRRAIQCSSEHRNRLKSVGWGRSKGQSDLFS
jgi:hypothetical protein